MTDVPFGVLLSGGLDSSLVAAVALRHLEKSEAARQWGSQLHTFCIGLKVFKFKVIIRFLNYLYALRDSYYIFCFSFQGSPDLKAGREVADYLGTRHHEFQFTVQVYKFLESDSLSIMFLQKDGLISSSYDNYRTG